MATQKTSDFYWACRNGDLDTVKKILLKLKWSDINRIESNGSTALHAASYYGHKNIVRLLLQRGADTTIQNKYKKTAKEEASTDEIRALFPPTVIIHKADNHNDDDDMPQSEFVQLYPNAKGVNKSMLATRILKARLSTYDAHKYTISAPSNLKHLREKYCKLCEEKGRQNDLEIGEECFAKYQQTGNFNHIIYMFTTETPFYGMIHGDETLLVEIYKHLFQYDKYNFQGRTYCGLQLFTEDLEPYRWALTQPQSLLEIRKLMGTSKKREVALQYMNNAPMKYGHTLFEFEFSQQCFTTIDAESFSYCPHEAEVLVLSGTFFSVTEVREIQLAGNNVILISLVNVPTNKEAL